MKLFKNRKKPSPPPSPRTSEASDHAAAGRGLGGRDSDDADAATGDTFLDVALRGRARAQHEEDARRADPPGRPERDALDAMLKDVVSALRAARVAPTHPRATCRAALDKSLEDSAQFDYARHYISSHPHPQADVWWTLVRREKAHFSLGLTEHGVLVDTDFGTGAAVWHQCRLPFIGDTTTPLPTNRVLDRLAFLSEEGRPALAIEYDLGGDTGYAWCIASARELMRDFVDSLASKPRP